MKKHGIVIHGGAGTVSVSKMNKWKREAYKEALKTAYSIGFLTLERGGSAVDAVVEAIKVLEDSPYFNAGKGSVYNHYGEIEMDASIMNGKNLNAGAIAAVPYIKNPIQLAMGVMKKSKHILLSGERALDLARDLKYPIERKEYFETDIRYAQWQRALSKNKVTLDHDFVDDKKFGTVGAVALDKKGNLAAGTSTGGLVNKKFGRIGDSPLIGIGNYANNETCAISCTGHGEYFMKNVVAHEVSARMKYLGESIHQATHYVIKDLLVKKGGKGGLIGMDTEGNIVMPFNSKGMFRAYKSAKGSEGAAIFGDEKLTEQLRSLKF